MEGHHYMYIYLVSIYIYIYIYIYVCVCVCVCWEHNGSGFETCAAMLKPWESFFSHYIAPVHSAE